MDFDCSLILRYLFVPLTFRSPLCVRVGRKAVVYFAYLWLRARMFFPCPVKVENVMIAFGQSVSRLILFCPTLMCHSSDEVWYPP